MPTSSIALAALMVILLPPGAGSVDVQAAPEPPAVEIDITSADPAWTSRVEWALDRLDRAGLDVPSLTVEVHDDRAPCNGASGLYLPTAPPQVHLCSQQSPDSRAARLIALHELAHAWAETQLTEEERQQFLSLRELDAWIDDDLPRYEWGAEHAAEVVAWGLMDEEIPIVRINDAQPDQLLPAFQLLVNQTPSWMHAERF